jgi:hypothetical protein
MGYKTFNNELSGNKMTLGVRPIKEEKRMSRSNGSGAGFFGPNSHTTRVSTVDNFQKRGDLLSKASMNKTATNNLFLTPIDIQHVKDYIAPRGEKARLPIPSISTINNKQKRPNFIDEHTNAKKVV